LVYTYLKRIFGNNKKNLYKGDNQAYLDWLGVDQKAYESRYHCSSAAITDYADGQLLMHACGNTLLVESPAFMPPLPLWTLLPG
jgi:hypothetical protein